MTRRDHHRGYVFVWDLVDLWRAARVNLARAGRPYITVVRAQEA